MNFIAVIYGVRIPINLHFHLFFLSERRLYTLDKHNMEVDFLPIQSFSFSFCCTSYSKCRIFLFPCRFSSCELTARTPQIPIQQKKGGQESHHRAKYITMAIPIMPTILTIFIPYPRLRIQQRIRAMLIESSIPLCCFPSNFMPSIVNALDTETSLAIPVDIAKRFLTLR